MAPPAPHYSLLWKLQLLSTPRREAAAAAGGRRGGDSRASRALALRPPAAASRGQGQRRRRSGSSEPRKRVNPCGGEKAPGRICPAPAAAGEGGERRSPSRPGSAETVAGAATPHARWRPLGPRAGNRGSSARSGRCPSPRGAEPSPAAERPAHPPSRLRIALIGAGQGQKGALEQLPTGDETEQLETAARPLVLMCRGDARCSRRRR